MSHQERSYTDEEIRESRRERYLEIIGMGREEVIDFMFEYEDRINRLNKDILRIKSDNFEHIKSISKRLKYEGLIVFLFFIFLYSFINIFGCFSSNYSGYIINILCVVGAGYGLLRFYEPWIE